MSRDVARKMGVMMILAALIVWLLGAFGALGVVVPEYHFRTIIWAAVALLLGYDVRNIAKSQMPKNDK